MRGGAPPQHCPTVADSGDILDELSRRYGTDNIHSGVSSGGLEVLVSAPLSVMSIVLGVMVGSGLATAHTPRVSTLIDTVVPHHLPWIHTAGTSKKPDSDS